MVDVNGSRWLTYAAAGELLGLTPEAVRQRARRQKWPKRTPNMYGDLATILVPEDARVRPRPALPGVHTAFDQGTSTPPAIGDYRADMDLVRAFDRAIAALQDQLERESTRAEHAEHQVEALHADLTDARTAQRIASANAAFLLSVEDERRRWTLWRRLRWAIRPR
jgi:hypothetical protein